MCATWFHRCLTFAAYVFLPPFFVNEKIEALGRRTSLSQGEGAEAGFQASSVHPASSLHTPCFALTEINLLNRTGLIIEGSLKAGPAVPSVARISKWAAHPRAVHANELDEGPLQDYLHWQPGQWPAQLGPATHTAPRLIVYPALRSCGKQVRVCPPMSFPVALVTLGIGMKPRTLSSRANGDSAGCVSTWHKGHRKLVVMSRQWDR